MENILELQQVSKTFPKSNFTLKNVTFSLPYGAILGFVGENGAGKTTTIGCILNTMILSILVDTFISKISFPMQPGPEIGSISDA